MSWGDLVVDHYEDQTVCFSALRRSALPKTTQSLEGFGFPLLALRVVLRVLLHILRYGLLGKCQDLSLETG